MNIFEPLGFSVKDLCGSYGLSRSTIYKEIKLRHLPVVKVGDRTMILASDWRQFLEERRNARHPITSGPSGRRTAR